MLSFSGSLKVFVALEPCDLRKGFNGLQAQVGECLKEDLRSGALFVFCNKRRTRLKVIYWDGTGLWLLIKRLEQGTFCWPKSVEAGAGKLRLTPEAFAMPFGWLRALSLSKRLTDGIDLRGAKMRPWYERE